jgi:DNA-binding NarL/FixJ family response regulator
MDLNVVSHRKIVSICETKPLTIHGLQHLLDETDDLSFGCSHASPSEWMLSRNADRTDVLIIDKGLGAQTVLNALDQLPAEHGTVRSTVPAVVI